jgi:hypothetical protein
MPPSITTKTGIETFAGWSTARAGVGQTTERRELVRTEGKEEQRFDGLVRQS